VRKGGSEKIPKNLNQAIWYPGQNSKRVPFENKPEALPLVTIGWFLSVPNKPK
jgi:hypothetical protein